MITVTITAENQVEMNKLIFGIAKANGLISAPVEVFTSEPKVEAAVQELVERAAAKRGRKPKAAPTGNLIEEKNEVEESDEIEIETGSPALSKETVLAALKKFHDKHGLAKTRAILTELKVSKPGDIKESDYSKAIELCNKEQ